MKLNIWIKLLLSLIVFVSARYLVLFYTKSYSGEHKRRFLSIKQPVKNDNSKYQLGRGRNQFYGEAAKVPSNVRHENSNFPMDPIDDYYRYPCVQNLDIEGSVPCVRTICKDVECGHSRVHCTALPLRVINNTKICTYDPSNEFISIAIKTAGGWETNLVQTMMDVLKANPDMMLVDIGCNIGIYTLAAAWMSRKVVCVDANYENIRLVHKSLELANLDENVILVWNALSTGRGVARLNIAKGNIGGARMNDTYYEGFKFLKDILVQTIILDDLQAFVRGKPIFMKMDIEDYELKALKGAQKLLTNEDVRYIQMEFAARHGLRSDTAKLLREYGFLPFWDVFAKQGIDIKDIPNSKDGDVYYIKSPELQ